MKIAFLCPQYECINRGAESFVREVTGILKRRGHTVDIYSLTDKNVDGVVSVKGVRIDRGMGKRWEAIMTKTRVDSFLKKFIGMEPSISHLSYFLSLSKNFHAENYDVIWNNAEFFGAFFCYKVKRKTGITVVSTFHGNESALMITEALVKPDVFAVLTPKHLKFLKKYVKKNVICIPNGVDLEKFKPMSGRKKKEDYPVYMSTSALAKEKRVNLIIEAIARLDQGLFIFTSDGPELSNILDLAKEKLNGRHRYLGRVENAKLPEIYNNCDVYVNASQSEGHSLSILEALACNKPVVSTDDENRKWTIGAGGLVVDVTDIEKFSEKLKEAATIDWNGRPRSHAETFSWEKTVDGYECAIHGARE